MVRESWVQVPLGTVITLQRGFDLTHKNRREGSVPVITSSGLNDFHDEAKVKAPGVVTGRYGTIGEVFYVTEDFWPHNTTLFVNNFKGNDPLFVYYLLHTIDFKTYSGKSGVPGINRNDIHEAIVSIPSSVAEQRAIAKALHEVDAKIISMDELIAKKREIKQSVMQKLVRGEERLVGYSGGWLVKSLGEILNYEQPSNYLVKHTEYNSNYSTPVLTAGRTFILGYTNEQEGVYTNLPVIVFDDFTTASRFVDFPFKIKSSAIKLLTTKSDDVDLRFVFGRLQTMNFVLSDHKRYYISEYQQLEIELPSPEEQKVIADIFSDMEAEITTLENYRQKTIALKQGMMQELLTGRTRLV